jgi:hypothetical protein
VVEAATVVDRRVVCLAQLIRLDTIIMFFRGHFKSSLGERWLGRGAYIPYLLQCSFGHLHIRAVVIEAGAQGGSVVGGRVSWGT